MIGYEWFRVLDTAGYAVLRILLSILWQSTILLLAAGALAFLLRRRSETVRHAVWTAAVLALPLLPLLSLGAARLGFPHAEIAVIPVYETPRAAPTPVSPGNNAPILSETETAVPAAAKPSTVAMPESSAPAPELSILDYPWALALAGYLLAVSALLLWMLVGRFRIRGWIVNGSAVLDPRVLNAFRDAAERIGIRREIPIMYHGSVPAPLTCRILRPVVILPAGIAEGLSDSELQAIALHELAHVKRRDTFIFTLVALVRAVFFFQPLVWYAARQVSYLAECVCDSAVLESGEDPAVYAELLTRIAFRLPEHAPSVELAAGILFTNSSFFRRVREILSDRSSRLNRLSRRALAGVAVTAFFSLVVAAALPLNEKNDEADGRITLSGKVFQENQPVSGAKIYVYYPGILWFPGVGEDDRAVEAGKTKKDGSFSVKINRSDLKEVKEAYPTSFLQEGQLPVCIVAYRPGFSIGWSPISPASDMEHIEIQVGKPETIRGTVQDRMGNPIKAARITLLGMFSTTGTGADAVTSIMTCSAIPEMTVETGANGEFVLNGLPHGVTKIVKHEAKGFVSKSNWHISPENEELICSLAPESIIEGRIVHGDTGKPAKDVSVQALMLEGELLLAYSKAITSSDGRFRIQALPPGKYIVALSAGKTLPDLVAVPVENIRVEFGETITGIELKLIPGGLITGKVTDEETGEPIRDQLLRLKAADTDYVQIAGYMATDENGEYRLRSFPGKMQVMTYAVGKYETGSWSQQEVTVSDGRTISGVDFQFKKGIGIAGRVLSPDGKPVEGAIVTVNIRGSFSPIDTATTDSAGRFELFGPKEGAKVFLTAIQEKLQLKCEIEFEAKTGDEAEIRLEKYGTASVRGRVLDEQGKPLRNAEIKLYISHPKTGTGTSHTAARTDRNGRYQVNNIIIGSRSSLSVEMNMYAPTEIKMPDLNSSVVEAEDTIVPRATRWLEGTVKDTDGSAISGARVIVNGEPSGFVRVRTDDRGHYRLDGLVPMVEKSVTIDHKDYGWFEFENIPTNERKDFTLPQGKYNLSGRVVDESGAPVERALVGIDPQKHPSGRLYGSVYTDSKGKFRFEHVLDDTVTVEIRQSSQHYPMRIPGLRLSLNDTTFVLKKNAPAQERKILTIEPGGAKMSPTGMHQILTIEPVDKEYILRQIPDDEKNGAPAFTKANIPNLSSIKLPYFFHLPAAAHTRIELCDADGKVVLTPTDEHIQKGVYQIDIIPAVRYLENGEYTVKLIVDEKLVGTKEFAVKRPGRFGKRPVEILPGVTIASFDEADVLPIPGEENTGGPAFVFSRFSNPYSNILCFYFILPNGARTRIELCDDEDKVVSTLIDEFVGEGAYKLTFGRPFTFKSGKYTLKLIVDEKLAGRTKKFTILK